MSVNETHNPRRLPFLLGPSERTRRKANNGECRCPFRSIRRRQHSFCKSNHYSPRPRSACRDIIMSEGRRGARTKNGATDGEGRAGRGSWTLTTGFSLGGDAAAISQLENQLSMRITATHSGCGPNIRVRRTIRWWNGWGRGKSRRSDRDPGRSQSQSYPK